MGPSFLTGAPRPPWVRGRGRAPDACLNTMDEEQLQQIRRLLSLVDRFGLAELTVQEDGVTITIRGPESPVAAARGPLGREEVTAGPEGEEPFIPENGLATGSDEDASEDLHRLYSPMTGVFYRSSSPETPAYVEVGDDVEEGQTVGLIEAMKVFSEIPADVHGRVVRIVAESGKLVNQGEVLMLIELETPSV
jgi:acetyl-CoA carboxylase biotin carboxyl carrier protein